MTYELIFASLSLITIVSLVTALVTRLEYKKRLERAKKTPAPTQTAQEILHDLTSGGSTLLRIQRVAPDDVFLRSPRGL